jgi:hypothetical protein
MRNIDRFRSDLGRLLEFAGKLEIALLVQTHGAQEVAKAIKRQNISPDVLNSLPNFNVEYETWYSEGLALLKQVLPDRVLDFRGHYEAPKNRKEISYATYRIQDALRGLRVTRSAFDRVVVDDKAAVPHFNQQIAILKAAEKRFESTLFEMRQLVQADLFDSELESARELLKGKFLRAAGAVSGVVLEKHLHQVCDDHRINIAKKNPTINDLNELLKANSIIDVPQWRFISMLGDIRNVCDHNKRKEPSEQQVIDLIDGTEKIIKTIS